MSDVKEYRKLLRCNGLAELSVHLLGTTNPCICNVGKLYFWEKWF